MPSTHAMVGVSIPFSVLLFTMNRYQYNVPLGMCIAIVWCALICFSRLYLGMHTVLIYENRETNVFYRDLNSANNRY
ncbi:hypothetical protein NQ318_005333 [Aromia moschata]|uniref:Phosphatidic acid phosphatase type 2/haloperoxidase domain-containing protein n=1 Tax=Aromia moschata TaxID=1265417 RepID=A0AAV8XHZ4_9CUCU|nr:hypothetical protein NQ318_005333 [Aromia moschata]